jgi:hypothetical protein
VQEEDSWSIKGRFTQALQDEDSIEWQEQNGGLVLPLLIVCIFISIFYLADLFLAG